MLSVVNEVALMPKPNFCSINEWKVLFCSVVALFLEDLTPSRLQSCQNMHLDKGCYCFAKRRRKPNMLNLQLHVSNIRQTKVVDANAYFCASDRTSGRLQMI